MLTVVGTYKNGIRKLDESPAIDHPVKVIVTFIEEKADENRLTINDFSFLKSRRLLKDVKGTLSDAVIEERRSQL